MITDENGNVALRKYRTINQIVTVGGEEYLFNTKANICLAWVKPEHVDAVLNIKRTCCGGNKKPAFTLADETAVRRWTNGGGR
ncbi:MAG: hypothetical protein BV458_09935 [Thermoplasmata archaeon M9B2D]|nr:MAG: hypothetical protein BV458_09935 [Thermoplasmata archaeon M9B2D]